MDRGIAGVLLDPEAIERDRAVRLKRFHTVRSPPLRVVGKAMFLAAAWAHQAVFLPDPALAWALQMVTVATAIYVLVSWFFLVKLYDRIRWVNLGDIFLTTDGFVALGIIYATGGEHSLLFFFMMLRAADQSAIGRRRTLFFGGLSVVFYLSLMVGLELVPGRDVAWGVAWFKTGVIAGINLYLVAVASTADRYHRATAKAVRLARSLIGDLEKKSSQLREEKQKAQAASVAKSQFLANMSHEIRTPMNAIIGVNRLQMKTELSAEAADYARTIEISAESLLQLIDDILDLSKVEADKLEIEEVTFSLTSLLDHITELIAPRTEAKGTQFILDRSTQVPQWVRGDPGRIQQVLLNLVSNAVKFTDVGGVTLVVGLGDEGKISFQVQDTGIGISPEDASHLFEPFAQATSSTARRFGGTGLGLAISRQLVELMSGTIELDSVVGIGTTFTVVLPLPEVEESAATDEEPSQLAYRSRVGSPGAFLPSSIGRSLEARLPVGSRELDSLNVRVLVADDNEVNRLVMKLQLQALGIPCDLVESGAEVFEALAKRPYDLLLLDCQMPTLDGYETARRIRASETVDRLTIVAVTAHAMKGDRDRCLAAGMDDYLAKPFREAELQDVLIRWFDQVSPPSSVASASAATVVEASGPSSPEESSPEEWSRVLDAATIESLRRLETMGDDDRLLPRLGEVFLDRIPELVEELRRDIEAEDAAAIAMTTHNLKGTSGTVGANALMAVCAEVEERALVDDLAGVSTLYEQVEEEAQRAIVALREALVG